MSIKKKSIMAAIAAVVLSFAMVSTMPVMTYAENNGEAGSEQGESGGESGGGALSKAQGGLNKVNEKTQATTDLEGSIGTILTIVYSIIGIIAVVMVILGGVSYATSQGDPGKVKKGKDTILYGIIGLVIVLMAFAITQFVLNNLS